MLSKATLTKLIALDVAESVMEGVRESIEVGCKLSQQLDPLLVGIQEAKDACFKLIAPSGKLELNAKEYERYKNTLIKAREFMQEQWHDSYPAEAAIILAMDIIEQVRSHMRKNKQWIKLIDLYYELYQLYDTDLHIRHMDDAEKVSRKILNAIGG